MRRTALLFPLCSLTLAALGAQSPQPELPVPVPEASRAWRTGLDALGPGTGAAPACNERGENLKTRGAELDARQDELERERIKLNQRLDIIQRQAGTLAGAQSELSRQRAEFNATQAGFGRRADPGGTEGQRHADLRRQLEAAEEALAGEFALLERGTRAARNEADRLRRDIADFEALGEAFQVDLARHEAACRARDIRVQVTDREIFDTNDLIDAYAGWQSGEFERVLRIVTPLADQGDAAAQFIMGGLYDSGNGVPQDPELAAHWWRLAAEQGMARAQNEIAVMLSDGRGVPADPKQAVVWYRKAAEQGLDVAQANLAQMYWRGIGVERDDAEAVAWFHKAAGQPDGFGWAEYYLGVAYASGRGVRADQREAARWFGRAADRGYSDARYALGAMYWNGAGVRRDQGRAVHLWALAASDGIDMAETALERVLPLLPRRRIRGTTMIHAKPDADAAVVRTASDGETAYVLERSGDWIEVYLPEPHTLGYLNSSR